MATLGKNVACLLICFALSARDLLSGVYQAAKSGRLLPRLTLILSIHGILHRLVFYTVFNEQTKYDRYRFYSMFLMVVNVSLNFLGYTLLVLLYQHSVQAIFNREIPTVGKDSDGHIRHIAHPAIQSFNTHLLMLRPLEIIFRFITAPLRVLPDLIVLGETRCGTTNLCGHIVNLSSMPSDINNKNRVKCYTPFCAWAHPELDHKESFYFVGHYLGIGK